jgi:hypothetical protein
VGSLLDGPTLVFVLLIVAIPAVLIVAVVWFASRSRNGGQAALGTTASSDDPMTLFGGRWLRWDGTSWRDAETGSPIVNPPEAP